MTRNQITFVLLWTFSLAVLVIGSLVSPIVLILVVVAAGFIVSIFQRSVVPTGSQPRTPMQVLEQSSFWKGIAAVYTLCLLGVVVYHLAVDRIDVFDNLPFGLLILMIFGPALGPIAICQAEIYLLLGRRDS